jgi:hypothetical protein
VFCLLSIESVEVTDVEVEDELFSWFVVVFVGKIIAGFLIEFCFSFQLF